MSKKNSAGKPPKKGRALKASSGDVALPLIVTEKQTTEFFVAWDFHDGEPPTREGTLAEHISGVASRAREDALRADKRQRTAAKSKQASTAAKAPRHNARKVEQDEIASEFKKLLKQNHTPGEARGILVRRGLASQSIYRRTKGLE